MITASSKIILLKKAITQVNTLLLISISSLIIIVFIFFQILRNLINILKKYKEKVNKRNNNLEKVMSKNKTYDDNYVYNKNNDKLFIDNKNINKQILNSIENQKIEHEKELLNVLTLKKNLNMTDTLTSKINNKVLSNDNDTHTYEKPATTSFWSNLFFTQ